MSDDGDRLGEAKAPKVDVGRSRPAIPIPKADEELTMPKYACRCGTVLDLVQTPAMPPITGVDYAIEPEVAGGMGKNIVFDRILGQGTFVRKLHYEFDGWLGDELLEGAASFIVTEKLAREIVQAQLTGARFDEVEISTSGEFQDLHPGRQLPKFVWLRIDGRAGHEDFGIAHKTRLVVSERALGVLQSSRIEQALVTEFPKS